MKTKFVFYCLLFLSGSIIGGCSESPENNKGDWKLSKRIDITRSDKEALEGINEFSYKLMSKACEISDDGQFCVSPISVSMLLSMLANGSGGECHDQIMEALGSDDISTLNTTCEKLMHFLPCDENGSSLAINNKFWIAQHNKVSNSFKSTMKGKFNADVDCVDFGKKSTVQNINKWVYETTYGKITNLLDYDWEAYVDTEMIGANTVYFKGDWEKEFSPENTVKETFHGINGDVTVPMMHNQLSALFAYDSNLAVVRLEFEDARNFMDLYLPLEEMPVSEISRYLTPLKQKELQDSLERYKVTLSMPSFKYESETPLSQILDQLELSALKNADMSPMGLDIIPLNAIHKTSIKVDEKGAELAAVSAVEGSLLNINVSKKEVAIDFDRPFFYLIKNGATDVILMAGAITDPR